MATSPEQNPNQNGDTNERNDSSSFSYFLKTVVLREWWLIKSRNDVEGKSLCISGYASTKKEAQRLFNSAPITKRHDVFTLETADGIHIILQGFINKDRTLESGFSSEVFNQFVFGFPLDWEECVEKFFENAGAKDSSSISSPSKDVEISRNDCNVDVRRECSQVISGKFDDGASVCNREDHAAINVNSEQEEMNGPNIGIDGTEERTVLQNEDNRSISISQTDKSVGTVKNSAPVNIASTSGCHITSVSSTEVRKIVLAITSWHFIGTEKGKKRIMKKRAKGSPCAEEGRERSKSELIEYAEFDCPHEDNLDLSNYDQSISIGTSVTTLSVSSNKCNISNRKQKELETDKDVFRDVVTNISDASSIQGKNKALSGYFDPNKETSEAVVAEISAPGDFNAVELPSVERNTLSSVSRNSKIRKSSRLLTKMENEGKNKHVSGCSTKTRGKQKKRPMTPNTAPRINIPEAMNRVSSRLRSVEQNLNTEEKKEQKANSKKGSSKKAKRKISFDAQIEMKTSIQSPESLSLKRSRSGRLLLPALDFWRNQIPVYDADRSITGVQEEIVAAKLSKGSKSEPQKTGKPRR